MSLALSMWRECGALAARRSSYRVGIQYEFDWGKTETFNK